MCLNYLKNKINIIFQSAFLGGYYAVKKSWTNFMEMMQGTPQKTKIRREEEGIVSRKAYKEIPPMPNPKPAKMLPKISLKVIFPFLSCRILENKGFRLY